MMTLSRSDISDTNFTSRISLNMSTRKKLYKCDTCGAQLASRSALTLYFRTHTGEKPFSCDTRGSKFAQSGVLKRRVHLYW